MFSAIKSAFTSEPTLQTVDPLKWQRIEIPVVESRHETIETWEVADPSNSPGLSTLKTMLNKVGLDLAILDGKFVTKDGVAYISTKDKKPVATLRTSYDRRYKPHSIHEPAVMGSSGHKIMINQTGDKEVYGPVYNDALNVVKVWASGKSGGKKTRAKTYKKKRVSRKTRRHSR